MPFVPPGDKTGHYYIIASNLPFKTDWQRFKDYVRDTQLDGSCINVEHAHIYPNTGDGWVKIKGKADFLKAVGKSHMNSSTFENRALIVDSQNATKTVMLRDAAPIITSPTRNHNSTASEHYMPQPAYPHEDTTPSSPCTRQGAEYSYQQAGYSPVFSTSHYLPSSPVYEPTTVPYFATQSSGMIYAGNVAYAGSVAPTTPVFVPQPQPLYMNMAPFTYTQGPMSPPNSFSNSYNAPVIQTEARKIIITNIPRTASEKDLRDLLLRSCTKLKSRPDPSRQYIQDFELVRHADGNVKGHALIVLDSHHIAKRAVEALHHSNFQGREIHARFAKEGVEPSGLGFDQNSYCDSSSSAWDGDIGLGQLTMEDSGSNGNKDRDKFLRQDEKARVKDVSGKKEKEKEGRPKKRDKEEKEVKREKQPVVADGSCGRGKKR